MGPDEENVTRDYKQTTDAVVVVVGGGGFDAVSPE